ncbi:aminotransferase class V-fold PLP-dependent enzyme [Acetobacteraceae bacterium KSS8]|uniref:Cysteine desulfurase n=1 Tax=Endosaccharibacter trunci TaxID=2812733 RepID=A0ABT1W8T0_9PROT|nr:aminotransferase class V-fold PLP-dependent enzyme [Acetobacteraceae bacterium KSS8]
MSLPTLYLDANASEILRPEAREAAVAALDLDGNPSSVHRAGRQARALLEEARERIAAAFGADPAGLVFTSGGTEADALAILALGAGRRVLIGATEHDAVRAAAPGAARLPVRPDGTIDPGTLRDALDASAEPALVCLMLANNETGVLHPIAELAGLCRDRGALLHVDAVQAAGRVPVSLADLGADSLALSGHKLGGPKGAGALLLRGGTQGFHLSALIAGGGQERGRRGGTPSLPAIAGFAAAADAACATLSRFADLAVLRDRIESAARAQGAVVAGAGAPRLPNTSALVLPGRRADSQLIALDLAGIAVSAGAACSSGKVSASHVLAAMGFGTGAEQAIRMSLPWNATPEHADRFIAAYARMAATPSRLSA